MSSDKEHDEGELQQVVRNEVASNPSGCIDIVGIGGEKMPDVSDLEDPKDNPVDGGNDGVQGKRSVVNSVDTPDCMAPLLDIISRGVEGIVEARDGDQKP